MTKIVYNGCYGGFGISKAAMQRYAEIAGWTFVVDEYPGMLNKFFYHLKDPEGNIYNDYDIIQNRADPILVQVVEELGREANGPYSELIVQEIPMGLKYRIEEYDGMESIMTVNDYNWSTS